MSDQRAVEDISSGGGVNRFYFLGVEEVLLFAIGEKSSLIAEGDDDVLYAEAHQMVRAEQEVFVGIGKDSGQGGGFSFVWSYGKAMGEDFGWNGAVGSGIVDEFCGVGGGEEAVVGDFVLAEDVVAWLRIAFFDFTGREVHICAGEDSDLVPTFGVDGDAGLSGRVVVHGGDVRIEVKLVSKKFAETRGGGIVSESDKQFS